MNVFLHKNFIKSYNKFDKKIKEKVNERLQVFSLDPFDSTLNNHALQGEFLGFRSINVTGDLRALYRMKDDVSVEFVFIDTHSNLYS